MLYKDFLNLNSIKTNILKMDNRVGDVAQAYVPLGSVLSSLKIKERNKSK
jgi:hypothetical protein